MRLLTPAQFAFSVPRGSARSSAEEEREADSDGADVSDVSCGRSRSRWAAINMRSKMVVAFCGCGFGLISPAGAIPDGKNPLSPQGKCGMPRSRLLLMALAG